MNEIKLTDVLEEYALAAPDENDSQKLAQVKSLYPQFAGELDDFAAARALLKYAPEAEFSAAEVGHFQALGRRNLQIVLSELNAGENALESLTDAAKAKGLNRSKFAAALGLSVSLVQYLEKRRLEFSTIPHNVIAKVAEVLETGEAIIADYLNQAAVSPVNASFKATTRPEELKPKSFAEAVREDQTLSAEEKNNLLEM
ncbi:MAG: hypothetical protein ACR2L1_07310 [Pyrinomonadaceae bacterium]